VSDIAAMAQRIRDDNLAVIDFLDDRIEVLHEPASPIDGTVDREVLAGAMRMFASDDTSRGELLGVDVKGDEIVRRALLPSPDGGPAIAHTGRFRVVGDRIVAVHSIYAPVTDDTSTTVPGSES
jgi:hypothetical protein